MKMTMKSFNDLQKGGQLKRADASKMRLSDLHIEEGFNVKGRSTFHLGRESLDADDERLLNYVLAGGYLPPIEVRVRAESGAWICDGHRRKAALEMASEIAPDLMLDKNGDHWVSVVQCTLNDVGRLQRILDSNEHKPVTPLQIAEVFQRMIGFKLTVPDIAKRFGRSAQYVNDHLKLSQANHDVQAMVESGQIAATTAIQAVKQHGEEAGKVLENAVKVSKETGKKATGKAIKNGFEKISDKDRMNFLEKQDEDFFHEMATAESIRKFIDQKIQQQRNEGK